MYICAAHHFLVSVHQDAFCYILLMGGSPILTTCKDNKNHGGLRISLLHALFFVPLQSSTLCFLPFYTHPCHTLLALQVTTLIIPHPQTVTRT